MIQSLAFEQAWKRKLTRYLKGKAISDGLLLAYAVLSSPWLCMQIPTETLEQPRQQSCRYLKHFGCRAGRSPRSMLKIFDCIIAICNDPCMSG